VLEQGVLEAGGEVDLGAAGGRELVEHVVRQSARACWTAPDSPYSRATAKARQDAEVERDRGTPPSASGVRRGSCRSGRRPREADRALRPGVKLATVAVEVGFELVRCGVLLADLADLAADADGHAVGLERADEGGQLGRAHVVLTLLGIERGMRKVHQSRAVDVDVPVAGGDGVAAALRISSVIFSASAAYFLALNW